MEATASQSQKPDNHLMNICNVGSKGRKHRSRQTKTSDSLSLQTISKPSERLFFDKKVFVISSTRVRNRDDPWVLVTRLNPRGRVQGSSELEDPLQPSTFGNLSAAEDLAGVGLVVDLTDFGEEAVVHVEDEPVIGEFHEDPDSDSSGDDDSETDYH
ncbi:hypothetical protein Bca101_090716 [Brassica carinata]